MDRATLAVHEQQVIHKEQEQAKTKKQKRVGFGGFGFGRNKGHVSDGGEGREGDAHQVEVGYEKNGATSSHTRTFGQGHPDDYDKPTTLTVFPNYLKSPPGILRILQLLVGIIVCAAVNAERCFGGGYELICSSASGPFWAGKSVAGQGFVLFVAILFIFGNIALILYRLCTRPKITTEKSSVFSDKTRLGELGYDVFAVILYIIAASVESWYADWKTLESEVFMLSGLPAKHTVRNVYRSQWIAAAVFAWINVILYAISAALAFLKK